MAMIEICTGCRGSGTISCPVCEGRGTVSKKGNIMGELGLGNRVECPSCNGVGKLVCQLCGGVGKIQGGQEKPGRR